MTPLDLGDRRGGHRGREVLEKPAQERASASRNGPIAAHLG
ncbi:hypothetical protein [Pendulispora albinea]